MTRSRLLLLLVPYALLVFPAPPVDAAHARQDCVEDLNGDGIVNASDLAQLLSKWGETFPSTVDAVTPSSGPGLGGTAITITGTRLAGAVAVVVGGSPAVEFAVVSSTEITAVTPAGTAGPRNVTIITPDGPATLHDGFTYTSNGTLPWATIIEAAPNPNVVTSAALRAAIVATELPWRVRDNASQIEMLLVPPRTFTMGCSPSSTTACDNDENPTHTVHVTQPFYLGRFEVTQQEWTEVMGSNPSLFSDLGKSPVHPVEQVSWNMIQAFEAATNLRLPSEAEWELACRAGSSTAFNNSSNNEATIGDLAWFGACCWPPNSDDHSHPVGLKLGNALGFHDMHGNVWEWVEDWYSATYYSQSPTSNPPGPSTGTKRVIRGGSWYEPAGQCRSSARVGATPAVMSSKGGFRVARTP